MNTLLTPKDRKVLYELELSGRDSFAEVGRRSGLSGESVADRIAKLSESGVITGFTTVCDIGKLGLTGYAVWARLGPATERKRAQLFRKLEADPRIYWIAQLGGRFDLLFAIQARSPSDFMSVLGSVQNAHPQIEDLSVAMRVGVWQFRRSYLIDGGSKRASLHFSAAGAPAAIDDVDRALLTALIDTPRISVDMLARKCEISRPTVYARLKELRSRGIYQGVIANIDCSTYGYQSSTLLLQLRNGSDEARQALRDYAASNPNIIYYIEVIGPWHVELHCEAPTLHQLQQTAADLRSRFASNVRSVEIVLCFQYYAKYRFGEL
ncbi:MAG: AsnC family transcriptional regulator [Bdellovibrionota bacterium]